MALNRDPWRVVLCLCAVVCVASRRTPLRNSSTNHNADYGSSIYVVRKIRASIAEGEQLEKPVVTPCSAIAEMRAGRGSRGDAPVAPRSPEPDVDIGGAAGSESSSGTAVQKCGS